MIRIEGLHNQLHIMVKKGQLSPRKIVSLINLKEFIEKYATVPFIPQEEVEYLEKKFGAKPEILTWGDYFQTEVASRYFFVSDPDFEKIVDTIKFDVISSIKIFKNKSDEFKNRIKEEALVLRGMEKETYSHEEEQILHLAILLEYYEEMGLENAEIRSEEEEWFSTFLEHHTKQAM